MREIRTKPSFVIDQLVPSTGITLIFGPPSCGKSTMLWTMADAIRRGKPFLGKYKTTKSLTLLLNIDTPGSVIWSRMHAAGYEPDFDICDFANHFDITALHATAPDVYAALKHRARRYQVIMIDTLSTITTGLSLKEDWVPGMTVSALRGLFPNHAIIVLHHSRKQSMGQFGPLPPHREDALGSNLWMAMVQSELQMYLKGDHLAHLRIAKSQVAPEAEGDDVYVYETGCRILPYLPQDSTQWLQRLFRGEQAASSLDATYKTKPLMERYTILGTLLSPVCSGATVRRWVKRSQYKMIT